MKNKTYKKIKYGVLPMWDVEFYMCVNSEDISTQLKQNILNMFIDELY